MVRDGWVACAAVRVAAMRGRFCFDRDGAGDQAPGPAAAMPRGGKPPALGEISMVAWGDSDVADRVNRRLR
jgi:hypothetical protein